MQVIERIAAVRMSVLPVGCIFLPDRVRNAGHPHRAPQIQHHQTVILLTW